MKTIIFILSAFLFFACAESDAPELVLSSDIPENANFIATRALSDAGVYPDSTSDIQYVRYVSDSLTYKLAIGMRDSCAWIAKFTTSGEEIFSFVLPKDATTKPFSYLYCNQQIIDNFLFIFSTTDIHGPEYGIINPDYTSSALRETHILSVLNFTTGEEILRLPEIAGTSGRFYVITNDDYYEIVESGGKISRTTKLSLTGQIIP